jgi:hypothetical protein
MEEVVSLEPVRVSFGKLIGRLDNRSAMFFERLKNTSHYIDSGISVQLQTVHLRMILSQNLLSLVVALKRPKHLHHSRWALVC